MLVEVGFVLFLSLGSSSGSVRVPLRTVASRDYRGLSTAEPGLIHTISPPSGLPTQRSMVGATFQLRRLEFDWSWDIKTANGAD